VRQGNLKLQVSSGSAGGLTTCFLLVAASPLSAPLHLLDDPEDTAEEHCRTIPGPGGLVALSVSFINARERRRFLELASSREKNFWTCESALPRDVDPVPTAPSHEQLFLSAVACSFPPSTLHHLLLPPLSWHPRRSLLPLLQMAATLHLGSFDLPSNGSNLNPYLSVQRQRLLQMYPPFVVGFKTRTGGLVTLLSCLH
jgi:hypothetical protein